VFKAVAKYRSDRDAWYVYVPKFLCPSHWTGKKGRRISFSREKGYKKAAEAYASKINKLIRQYGQQIKVPSSKELLRLQKINEKIGDYNPDEVLEVGLTGVKNRSSSILLGDFIPLISKLRKSNGDPYNAATLEAYRYHLNNLMESCGNIYLSDIDRYTIEAHLDSEILNYSPNYQVSILRFLSGALSKAKDSGYIEKNPCFDTKTYSQVVTGVGIYDISQCKRLLTGASVSLFLSHLLGLSAGLRPSECRRTKYEYIKLDKRKPCIILPSSVCKGGKKGKTVYLSDNWIEWIRPIFELGLKGYIAPFPETPKIRESGHKVIKATYNDWYHKHWIKDMENPNRLGGAFTNERVFDGHRHSFASYTYWFERETDRSDEGALNYTKAQLGHYQSSDVAIKHYVNLDQHIEDIGEWAREFFSLFPPPSYGETIGETLEYCQQVSAVA